MASIDLKESSKEQHKTGWRSSTCSVAQLCPILCDRMNCSLPGSSILGISQARILEWVAISSSRGSSWSRDLTHVSCIARQILYHWATRNSIDILIIQINMILLTRWFFKKNMDNLLFFLIAFIQVNRITIQFCC